MNTIKISVAEDFSVVTGPRYIKEGDFSGEEFREKILSVNFEKAIAQNKKILVDLDGTFG